MTSDVSMIRHGAEHIVDFVDILAKLDKINRITDGW